MRPHIAALYTISVASLLVLIVSAQAEISSENPPLQTVVLIAPNSASIGINAATATLQYGWLLVPQCGPLCSTRNTAVSVPMNETTLPLVVGIQTGNETQLPLEQLALLNVTAQGSPVSPLTPTTGPWPGWTFFSTGVTLPSPGVKVSVNIPANALPPELNTPTLASNTIQASLDNTGPTPTFALPSPLSTTPTLLVGIDFGERITASDPKTLFTLTCIKCPEGSSENGTSRVESLYDVQSGVVYLSMKLQNPNASTVLELTVPAGVTTDIIGNPNFAASTSLSYIPESTQASSIGNTMANMMKVAWPVTMLASVAGVSAPTDGASISNRALVSTMVGTIPLIAMPPIYTSFSDAMGFVQLDVG